MFDNRSGRLLSCEKELIDASAGAVAIRTIYSDYRRVAGVDVPMQMASFREKAQLVELKIIKLEILPTVEPRLFSKPE